MRKVRSSFDSFLDGILDVLGGALVEPLLAKRRRSRSPQKILDDARKKVLESHRKKQCGKTN